MPVLRLVAFAMPPLACCIIFTSALRGAGDTRVPVLFTWVGFLVVRIPLAYSWPCRGSTWARWEAGPASASDCSAPGLAMIADLLVRGAFFLLRFRGGRWQRIEVNTWSGGDVGIPLLRRYRGVTIASGLAVPLRLFGGKPT